MHVGKKAKAHTLYDWEIKTFHQVTFKLELNQFAAVPATAAMDKKVNIISIPIIICDAFTHIEHD